MQVYIQGIEAIGMSLHRVFAPSATTFGQQRLLDLIPLPLMMREDALQLETILRALDPYPIIL